MAANNRKKKFAHILNKHKIAFDSYFDLRTFGYEQAAQFSEILLLNFVRHSVISFYFIG